MFYGASWDQKSVNVANQLSTLLATYNGRPSEDDSAVRSKYEVVYASCDHSEFEYNQFLSKQ